VFELESVQPNVAVDAVRFAPAAVCAAATMSARHLDGL
jgi:hypothetical protein